MIRCSFSAPIVLALSVSACGTDSSADAGLESGAGGAETSTGGVAGSAGSVADMRVSSGGAAGGNVAAAGAGGSATLSGEGNAGASGTAGASGAAGGAGASGQEGSSGGAGSQAGGAAMGGSGGSEPDGDSGGAATGGAGGNGGSGMGGEGGMGGEAPAEPEEICPLPDTFSWTSSGPIAQPREGWASIKDFTALFHDGQYIVYMTNHDTGTEWGAAMFTFGDWSEAATATQQPLDRLSVAPTMFYFEPKDLWVLAYQWGSTSFSYATSSDPTDPSGWSPEQNLYNYTGSLPNSGTGPIDQHVICDETDCYLFFNGDNGEIYRSSMPIEDFPGTFPPHETIMSRSTNALFEAVAVYSLKGSDEYLMLMESIGGGQTRYFSAFTATDLAGDWTDLKTSEADPFAGRNNVTFEEGAWTNDISHGDLVRYNPDQTMEVDPCRLELLYQGRDPASGGQYGLLPYRPGLLTLQR